ncbi:hypothetical protein HU200_018235 [Digitaria exilis]|uniref:3-beta hydroxysteroid dehydrogenase/isomerase domain-containing protein n=1 Tax=Digitaria exilis TaxID=1010633 RepID=A0A835F599_9POAL|nr:hypothetical protein HU200_018235 [Digitaria exilis]
MESLQLLDDGNGSPAEPRWCAVTGGRGFLARHLVAALLRSGEWRVRVADLAPGIVLGPDETEQLLGDALRDGRAIYAPADVCNLEQLTKAFEGVDVVFHTACADYTKNDPQLHNKVNVQGTNTVVDACKICKVKRLIYTSSSAVVFDGVHGHSNVNESKPYPDKFPDAYAKTKAEAEKLVMKANETSEILTCCIRPGSIFGPGDKIVPLADYYGRIQVIIGDGKNYDDFVYVENVVHAHMCAERALRTKEGAKISGGKAYFVTNMEQMNLWDFNYMVQEELGYKRPFRIRIPFYVVLPIRMQQLQITPAIIKYAALNRTFSCNKAMEELGYKPTVTIRVIHNLSSYDVIPQILIHTTP